MMEEVWIWDVLKKLRDHEGSMKALADKAGLNKTMLSRYVNKRDYPGEKNLSKITILLKDEDRKPFMDYFLNEDVKYRHQQKMRPMYPTELYIKEQEQKHLKDASLEELLDYCDDSEKERIKQAIAEYIGNKNVLMARLERKIEEE